MQRRGNLLTSSLASGFIFGFLSGIPILGALNCACCSLIVGAGVLTSYLLVKGSDIPVSYGRAALGGLLAGLIAVPVYLIASFAFSIIMGGGDFQAEFERNLDEVAQQIPQAQEAAQVVREMGLALIMVFVGVLCAVFYSVFGLLGGLLGRALFERRTPAPVPVPETGTGTGTMMPRDDRWQGPEGGNPPVNPS